MKKVMKGLVMMLGLSLLAALTGCGDDSSKIKIGIIQTVEHPALDASHDGFIDGLKEAGLVDGSNIKVDYQVAQGDQSNCVTIAQKFSNNRYDLILAIGTQAAQAVANTTQDIPILVTAVTDPKTAELVQSNEHPGTNVSGTSDLVPIAPQIELLQRLVPNAKKIAFLYCSSETNSIFQVNLAKTVCDSIGLQYIDATVSNTNEIQQVVQSLVGKIDAIFTPTDNMIASSMPTVALVATEAKIPVICGEENMVKQGGLATTGLSYYELGKQTSIMAVDILKNGAKTEDMPIQYSKKFSYLVNKEVAAQIGITVPEGL